MSNSNSNEQVPIHWQKEPYKTETQVEDQLKSSKCISLDPSFCVRSCDGHCCREYAILITVQDAHRILKAIPALDVRKFVYFYLSDIEWGDEYPKIKIQGKEYCLGMLFIPTTEACVFQTHLGLCGIHTFSPLICRTFPFIFNDKEDIEYKNDIICKQLIPLADPIEAKALIIQRQQELKEYHKIVDQWNKKYSDKTMLEFLKFTGLIS
jgi:Fe-S-cluster containining protein